MKKTRKCFGEMKMRNNINKNKLRNTSPYICFASICLSFCRYLNVHVFLAIIVYLYYTILYCNWSSFALCVLNVEYHRQLYERLQRIHTMHFLYNARTIIECTSKMILLNNGTWVLQLEKALYGCVEGAHIPICGTPS